MKNRDLDRHFLRNTLSISLSEFMWGVGVPVLLESTFLQIFLASAGASNTVIGFTGTMFSILVSVMPIVAAWFSSRFERKRKLVVTLHVLPATIIFSLGMFYFVFGKTFGVVGVFIIFYFLFSISIGLILPVWQNYVIKIFSPEKLLKGLSVMSISQNTAKLISGILIAWIIASYGLDLHAAAFLFGGSGILFMCAAFGYLFTKENPDTKPHKDISHPIKYIKHHTLHILRNKPMRFFIFHDFEFISIITVFSFYARFATEHCGIATSAAGGIFVVIAFAGAVSANVLFGFIWKGPLKGELILAKAVSAAGVLTVIIDQSFASFILASFFLGFARGSRFLLYPAAVKTISGLEDASPYYAIVPLMTVPLTSGFPVFAGMSIDVLAGFGGNAYRITFAFLLAVILASVYFLFKTIIPGQEKSSNR